MLEAIALGLGIGFTAALAFWTFYKGEKSGKNEASAKELQEAVESAVSEKAASAAVPVAGAAERLRNSRWNRDRQLLSVGEPDNDK